MFYATGLTGWQRAAMAAETRFAPPARPVAAAAPVGRRQEWTLLKQQVEDLAALLDDLRRQIGAFQIPPEASSAPTGEQPVGEGGE